MAISSPILLTSPNIESLLNPLTENIDGRTTLISLCGAGGKTSTLFWLADYFHQQGKKVLLTTSTRMFLPAPSSRRTLLIEADPIRQLTRCQALPDEPMQLVLFSHLDRASGKAVGPSPQQIDLLKGQQLLAALVKDETPPAQPLQPLAQLLLKQYQERLRLEAQGERTAQQLRESQRRAEVLQGKLEAMAGIEAALPPRPNSGKAVGRGVR